MKPNPLSSNPNHLSQPAGAALAFLGVQGCIPLWHGVQGCTAFAKVLLIGHFREPIPFQTTALGHTQVILGGEENVQEALDNLQGKAELIGLLTTGVGETSGVDLASIEKNAGPHLGQAKLVCVSTPDFEGSLETGWAKAMKVMLAKLVKPATCRRPKRLALLTGPYQTPGELLELRDIITDFGWEPVIFPDLGQSLHGRLTPEDYHPATTGGTTLAELASLSEAGLLLSLGSSVQEVARDFAQAHAIPCHHFDELITLKSLDAFYGLLGQGSLPTRYLHQRQHLQDCLLDVESYFYDKKVGLAGDPELIHKFQPALEQMGLAAFPLASLAGKGLPSGDLLDFAHLAESEDLDLLLGNSHVAELAEDFGLPVIRTGIPVEDRLGEPQSVRLGYRGAAHFYRQLANGFLQDHRRNRLAYRSVLQQTLI